MPTRKEFCRCCLAALLAGLTCRRPLGGLAGLTCRRPLGGLAGLACRRPLGGLAGLGALLSAGRREEEVKKKAHKKMIATCGLVCTECPAFIATQKNDDALRAKTAGEWSAMFHADIQAADIDCDGCLSAGPRLFRHCLECEIRSCAKEKKAATCAACPEYSCPKLDGFLAQVPEARKTLDGLRKL